MTVLRRVCLFLFPDQGAGNRAISRLPGIQNFFIANTPGFARRVCLTILHLLITPSFLQKRPYRTVANFSVCYRLLRASETIAASRLRHSPPKRSPGSVLRKPDIRGSPPLSRPVELDHGFQITHFKITRHHTNRSPFDVLVFVEILSRCLDGRMAENTKVFRSAKRFPSALVK